jgi:capsular exopolysaccharide synthesis family protein
MSGDNLAIVAGVEEHGATQTLEPAPTSMAKPENLNVPYRLLHQMLRGRYPMAITTGLLLGALVAVYLWHTTEPQYASSGLIRISYDIPKLNTTDDYKPMEVFEAFMQSQQALMTSHRVLSEALKDPQWQKSRFAVDPQATDRFVGGLKVEHRAGTEHLQVTYTSSNPVFAAVAANAVIDAYAQLYQAANQQSTNEKAAAMQTRRDQLREKMDRQEAELRQSAAEFGGSNVERFYDLAVQRLGRVESALIDVRIALALTERPGQAPGRVFLTPQQIARFDGTMGRYLAEREQLENEQEQLRLRGYGEGHKQMVQVQRALELVTARIRDYAMDFQTAEHTQPVSPAGPSTGVNVAGKTADALHVDEKNLTALEKEVKDQLAILSTKKMAVDAARSELDKAKGDYSELTQKMALLQVEAGMGGRMSIMSRAEIPVVAQRDRRAQAAALGGIGAFLLPSAAIIVVTAARRRYRYSEDAAETADHRELPLLGILPQLPPRLTEPEYAADAAQCVHQIRVMLQVRAQGQESMAYLMTSACPGEGKTSLTAALALSYAAAGAKTLLLDADLIGQRLTRGYRMEDRSGFREIVAGSLEVKPYETAMANLSIIPAGVSDGRDACAVSSGVVKRLLKDLRSRYDVILVDSGPILGSLEALVVAGQVDGVVLTISREQQKPLVDRAVRQLKSVGARIAGMVFNKAQNWDFRRSVSMSSLRSVSRSPDTGLVRAGVTSTSGFGSLVDSVQTYMPGAV